MNKPKNNPIRLSKRGFRFIFLTFSSFALSSKWLASYVGQSRCASIFFPPRGHFFCFPTHHIHTHLHPARVSTFFFTEGNHFPAQSTHFRVAVFFLLQYSTPNMVNFEEKDLNCRKNCKNVRQKGRTSRKILKRSNIITVDNFLYDYGTPKENSYFGRQNVLDGCIQNMPSLPPYPLSPLRSPPPPAVLILHTSHLTYSSDTQSSGITAIQYQKNKVYTFHSTKASASIEYIP